MYLQSWLSLFLLINICHVIISLPLSDEVLDEVLDEVQYKHCKGILINSSDVSPTVQANSTVTMTVIFNCTTTPHSVVWCSTVLGQHTDVTNKLIIVSRDRKYTSYKTSFIIQHLVDDNQGRYTLSVCGESLQYFFVSFDDPGCGNQSPPAAVYSNPNSHYIGPVAINYTMQCFLKGDVSSFDSQGEWNCSNEIITKSKTDYLLMPSDFKSCSYILSLTLINVKPGDSGNCSCYAVTVDGKVGKKLSFENTFLDYPSVLSEPKLNSFHSYHLADPLELNWRVSGTLDWNNRYILPVLSLNDTYFNTTECNECQFYFKSDSLLPSYSYLVFKVPFISLLTSLDNTSLRIQVYLKFQPFVQDVFDYNNRNANHSQVTIITIKEVSPKPFPWYYVYCGSGIAFVLIIGVVLMIGVIVCIRRRTQREHYHCVPGEHTPLLINTDNDDSNPGSPVHVRVQTPEQPINDNINDNNNQHVIIVSPLPVGDEQGIGIQDIIPNLVTPQQEITPPPSHSLPEEDKPRHSLVPYIRPSITFRSGATPFALHDLSADTSRDDEPLQTTPPNYMMPFVSHGHGLEIATLTTSDSSHIVAPQLTPERRDLETVAPPISQPLKIRVSASDEEEENEVERDGPVVIKPSTKGPCKVFVMYCNSSTDGVRAESLSHQVFLFIQLLNVLSRDETPSLLYDSYTCIGDVFLEPSQCTHITNWSNWTENQIREATHVILVCSPSLYNKLQQHTSAIFEMYRGPVSSDMVYNMFTNKEHGCKFIPVFLNSPLQSDLVPTPLRMRRCYTLRLEYIFRNFDLSDLSSEDVRLMGIYFDTHYHEMADFLDLVRLLKNREWE